MSRLVVDPKTNQAHKLPDTVLIPGQGMLEIVRSFTIGERSPEGKYAGMRVIYECPDGTFREQDGSLVKDKKSLKGMPKEYYDKAVEWLKAQGVADTTAVN